VRVRVGGEAELALTDEAADGGECLAAERLSRRKWSIRSAPSASREKSFARIASDLIAAGIQPRTPDRNGALDRARRPPAQLRGHASATVFVMSESLQVTIVYEQGEEGWVVASIPEVPGANSQGRTRDEARANVIDALRGILELRFGRRADVTEGADSEPLELVIGA